MKNGLAVLAVLLMSRTALAADGDLPALPVGTTVRIQAPKIIDIPGVLKAAEGRVAWFVPEVPGDPSRLVARVEGSQELIAAPQPGGTLEGQIVSVDAEGIVVTLEGHRETFRIPKEAIARLDKKAGTGSRDKHALVGLGIGLGIGLAATVAVAATCRGDGCLAASVGIFGSPILGLGFAGIGAALPAEHWQEVRREKVSVGIGPAGHGVGLRASIRF